MVSSSRFFSAWAAARSACSAAASFRPIAAAIVLLNSVVLLAALEFGLLGGFALFGRRTSEPRQPDPRSELEYYAAQPWGAQYWRDHNDGVQRTYGEFIRYEPYVAWSRWAHNSETINIDASGRRLTPGTECGQDAYRVLAFGGSTMWGFGAPDWETIPAHLQSRIRALRDGPVCVVNFGEGGYVSTQNLIHVIRELQYGRIPDLVIVYGGVNDALTACELGKPGCISGTMP